MRFNGVKQIEPGRSQNIFLDAKNSFVLHQIKAEKNAPKLLRFWGGEDYHCFRENERKEPRWLPIPENSEVQRVIKSPDRVFQYKWSSPSFGEDSGG
jgi:hypothetical protein